MKWKLIWIKRIKKLPTYYVHIVILIYLPDVCVFIDTITFVLLWHAGPLSYKNDASVCFLYNIFLNEYGECIVLGDFSYFNNTLKVVLSVHICFSVWSTIIHNVFFFSGVFNHYLIREHRTSFRSGAHFMFLIQLVVRIKIISVYRSDILRSFKNQSTCAGFKYIISY